MGKLIVSRCTFPLGIFPSVKGAPELENKDFYCVRKIHPTAVLTFLSFPSFSPTPHQYVGPGVGWGVIKNNNKKSSILAYTERVKRSGLPATLGWKRPQEGKSCATSSRYHPGSATPPLSRASTPLQFSNSLKVSGHRASGHSHSAKAFLRQGVPHAGYGIRHWWREESAHPSLRRPSRPPAAHGQGERGDRAALPQLHPVPSQIRRGTEHAGASFLRCSWRRCCVRDLGTLSLAPCPMWGRGAPGAWEEVGGEPEKA